MFNDIHEILTAREVDNLTNSITDLPVILSTMSTEDGFFIISQRENLLDQASVPHEHQLLGETCPSI